MIGNLKTYVDAAANIVKAIEELDPDAKVLDGIERSVQIDPYSCGAQSVFVILRYFKKRCTIEKVKKELKTDWNGTALEDIHRVLQKYGLTYRVRSRARLRHLRKAIDENCPVLISTLDGDHWSVVYGYSKSKIYVADPSLMVNWRCGVPVDDFVEQWDSWMLEARR